MSVLLSLFTASFLAATILPVSSEVMLYALLRDSLSPLPLLLAATTGNTLGSAVNWAIGRYLLHFRDRSWFYFKQGQIDAAQHWFQRYGIWSLLFAWVPLGGDVLTLVAGTMRVPFLLFIILVGLGKGLRYLSVFLLVQWQLLP